MKNELSRCTCSLTKSGVKRHLNKMKCKTKTALICRNRITRTISIKRDAVVLVLVCQMLIEIFPQPEFPRAELAFKLLHLAMSPEEMLDHGGLLLKGHGAFGAARVVHDGLQVFHKMRGVNVGQC